MARTEVVDGITYVVVAQECSRPYYCNQCVGSGLQGGTKGLCDALCTPSEHPSGYDFIDFKRNKWVKEGHHAA